MRFFISNDISKNSLLRLIITFTLVFFVLLWLTNLLLFAEIGFSYESIVTYYLGSEESFRQPKSYIGLLQESHFHLFSMAILLVTLTHLVLFANITSMTKLTVIAASYTSALGDIAGGWLIRYVSPWFAYLKLASFCVLQLSILALILISIMFLYDRRIMGSPRK